MNTLDIQQAQQAVDEATKQLKIAQEALEIAQEALENAQKPKKYEFISCDWTFGCDSIYHRTRAANYAYFTRRNQQQAAFAQKKLNQWLRISKFVADHGGDCKFSHCNNNWLVLFSHNSGMWETVPLCCMEYVGAIYMTKDVAKKLAEALNNGSFNIDGD